MIILLVGPALSGKTTFADTLFNAKDTTDIISSDAFRKIYNSPYTQEKEYLTFKKLNDAAINLALTKTHIIVDSSFLTRKSRKDIIKKAKKNNIDIVAVNMPINKQRIRIKNFFLRFLGKGYKPEFLQTQYSTLEPATESEGFMSIINPSSPTDITSIVELIDSQEN